MIVAPPQQPVTLASGSPRMTFAHAQRGPLEAPHRVILYGPEGIGKSTFAAGAPSPFFLKGDNGVNRLNVHGLKPETWQDLLSAVRLFLNEKHEYKTLALDSFNWYEALAIADVVGTSGKSIEDWGGGYGRGVTAMLDRWRELVSLLERVWESGMHIVMTAHSQVKSFNDPQGPSYDRFEIAMNQKAAGIVKQWVDYVLFARHEAFSKVDERTKKHKGFSTGARIIHTEWSAAYDAKWRGLAPPELALSWAAFDAATSNEGKVAELLQRIEEGLATLADPEAETKVRGFIRGANGNPDRLSEIENAVLAKIGEKA